MKHAVLAAVLCLAAACGIAAVPVLAAEAVPPDAADHRPGGIAWHDGDIDSAFARARSERRPLFVYWGAVWCPPCNQLKATLFKRPDFIERTRLFVPVYLDGDARGAQQLGTRFKVRGYPTTILMRPDGSEITRLPGEVDPQRYLDVLDAALRATHPVRELLAAALDGTRALTADEWRLLAFYSWETDEQQLGAGDAGAAGTVARLAALCPDTLADSRDRLTLKALALRAEAGAAGKPPLPATPAAVDRDTVATLLRTLTDPALARRDFDILVFSAEPVLGYVAARDAALGRDLQRWWNATLIRLAGDARLSNADRLAAMAARVGLARAAMATVGTGAGDAAADTAAAPLPAALLADVRAAVARADGAARDAVERQSVISAAAGLLTEASLLDESDALLGAELARSHSPYYFMLDLADNAKRRGDRAAALDWYARAHAAARGPATRLQWGAIRVRALLELAPEDSAQIESVTAAVLGEIEPVPASFDGRNRAALARMRERLSAWGAAPAHEDAWVRLQTRWLALCGKLPADTPQRGICAQAL